MIRYPAVAGQFYSGEAKSLRAHVEAYVGDARHKEKALGIIAPHAGYIYSGVVAGAVYGSVEVPETVVILGPNHHAIGSRAALYPDGEWITPLGRVSVNSSFSDQLLKNCHLIEKDGTAHEMEHSLEVQVPFLQVLRSDVTIVPLCLGFRDYASCRILGDALARTIREFGSDVLIVASSDMSHYEPDKTVREKDDLALREILELNPEGAFSVVRKMSISMCGIIPATVMLIAALELGARKGRLVRYATSGEVSGDFKQVVGYAAVLIT